MCPQIGYWELNKKIGLRNFLSPKGEKVDKRLIINTRP